jgi:hypothetical protein
MLKKLFYVSASILMLAASYYLGARNAGAQSPGSVQVIGPGMVISGGAVYYAQSPGLTPAWQAVTELPPVPVASIVYDDCAGNGASGRVITASGEGWVNPGANRWTSIGIIPGATPAAQPSWGKLKASYRK